MSPVVRFIIIAVLTSTAYCAPHLESPLDDVQVKLSHVYCTAVGLTSNAIIVLHSVPIDFTVQCQEDDTTAVETMNQTALHQLSDECRNFTMAMSLKHLLLDSLTDDDYNGQLSLILENLQTLANIFDEAALTELGEGCENLSAVQYKMTYCKEYNTTTSLIRSIMLFGLEWLKKAHNNGIHIRDC